MIETPLEAADLHVLLVRASSCDRSARDELICHVYEPLRRLAGAMLRGFPRVEARVEADDVLHGALMRLLLALETVKPASPEEFYGLATTEIRRELLDPARHFQSEAWLVLSDPDEMAADRSFDPRREPGDSFDDREDLEDWSQFHQAVEDLPVEEREVVGLVLYHGWSQAEMAELFQVTTRTVQRRLHSALVKLRHAAGDQDFN